MTYLIDGSGCFSTRHPEERSDEGSHWILQPCGLQDDPSESFNTLIPEGSFSL